MQTRSLPDMRFESALWKSQQYARPEKSLYDKLPRSISLAGSWLTARQGCGFAAAVPSQCGSLPICDDQGECVDSGSTI